MADPFSFALDLFMQYFDNFMFLSLYELFLIDCIYYFELVWYWCTDINYLPMAQWKVMFFSWWNYWLLFHVRFILCYCFSSLSFQGSVAPTLTLKVGILLLIILYSVLYGWYNYRICFFFMYFPMVKHDEIISADSYYHEITSLTNRPFEPGTYCHNIKIITSQLCAHIGNLLSELTPP